MSRPVGVTASAIVAILGSTFALLFAGVGIASLFIATTQPPRASTPQMMVAVATMFILFAGIGYWTAVGIFRLRPWARTSILVFAGFLAAGAAFSLLMTMVFPKSPNYSASTDHVVRLGMLAMFGIPLAIGVWWLIQFSTPSTKAAFLSDMEGPASPRPLSISIIGWLCIAGGATVIFPLLSRSPVFLFGAIFNGWSAGLIYAIFGALQLYIGKGLLDLRERARILAIAWIGFSFVHGTVVILVPSMRQRLLELEPTLEQNQPTPIPFEGNVMYMGVAFGTLVAATGIWFLIRNRAVFVRAETA